MQSLLSSRNRSCVVSRRSVVTVRTSAVQRNCHRCRAAKDVPQDDRTRCMLVMIKNYMRGRPGDAFYTLLASFVRAKIRRDERTNGPSPRSLSLHPFTPVLTHVAWLIPQSSAACWPAGSSLSLLGSAAPFAGWPSPDRVFFRCCGGAGTWLKQSGLEIAARVCSVARNDHSPSSSAALLFALPSAPLLAAAAAAASPVKTAHITTS